MIALAAAELALFWPRNCIRPEVTRSVTGSQETGMSDEMMKGDTNKCAGVVM